MKIFTRYWKKPIPDRSKDWEAYDDETHDIGSPVGYGATEADAIEDLKIQIEEKPHD
jgi:hypothetical protein